MERKRNKCDVIVGFLAIFLLFIGLGTALGIFFNYESQEEIEPVCNKTFINVCCDEDSVWYLSDLESKVCYADVDLYKKACEVFGNGGNEAS